MAVLPGILIFSVVLAVLIFLIIVSIRKGASGIKIMLLGIHITLLGGIIAVDPNSNLGGIEYLVALLGLIVSIVGLGKNSGDV